MKLKRKRCSAFTVAELGEMLPWDVTAHLPTKVNSGGWGVKVGRAWLSPLTEADARAKILIYLLENKLVDVSTLTH